MRKNEIYDQSMLLFFFFWMRRMRIVECRMRITVTHRRNDECTRECGRRDGDAVSGILCVFCSSPMGDNPKLKAVCVGRWTLEHVREFFVVVRCLCYA